MIAQHCSSELQALAALRRGWQLSVAMFVYRLRRLYRDRMVLELTPAART